MALVSRDERAERHAREQRSLMRYLWLKVFLGFLVPVAFFFGAEFGKQDTAAGYRALIKQLPNACQDSFERIVIREIPQ